MNAAEFERRLKDAPRPVMVDLWAAWCAPCRAMEPAFKQVSQKYAGQVDVLKIDADESPDVLKKLGVMGIPTVIGFAGGREIVRRTGTQSADALDVLFDAALNQRKPAVIPLDRGTRMVRSVLGLALLAFGWFNGQSIWLLVLGGVVLFSAFYDRCPVYRAIAPRVTALFRR